MKRQNSQKVKLPKISSHKISDEQAIPARFLMTTDNVDSDPDEYVKQFQINDENFKDVDLGVNNDALSLIEMDNELPAKRMVEGKI